MTPKGEIDGPGMARLLAWFEANGCAGAVLAGTNGEGPSLAAVEKRDLLRDMMPVRGKLDLIIGIATNSLSEAIWSCRQAAKAGATAALVMAPGYFREASEAAIRDWFLAVMDEGDLPVLAYNFPQRTGFTITADLLHELAAHERMVGAKDSSGNTENLAAYARAIRGKSLYVGNETLLLDALEAGWTGTISGAANVLPNWLSIIVAEWTSNYRESAEAKFELVKPAIEALRKMPQPAANKALLKKLGVLDLATLRLPLSEISEVDHVVEALQGLVKFPSGVA